MFPVSNLPESHSAIYSSKLKSNGTHSYYRQINKSGQKIISQTQMTMPLQSIKFNFEHQTNLSSSQFRPLMASRLEASKPQTNAKSSAGVHIFSLPIRRIRGIATALNRQMSCEYIFETVGRIIEEETPPKNLSCGIAFRLEEYNGQTRGLHLKCVFVDMEDINPAINCNGVYRCVGKFSIQHGTFQCYSVTPCDETDLQLQEIFQMFSDNVIAQMLSRN